MRVGDKVYIEGVMPGRAGASGGRLAPYTIASAVKVRAKMSALGMALWTDAYTLVEIPERVYLVDALVSARKYAACCDEFAVFKESPIGETIREAEAWRAWRWCPYCKGPQ